MDFHDGPIDGVLFGALKTFHDGRGWLCELFRHDELPAAYHPAMAYVSETLPGVTRGPHEHVDQADLFCFLSSARFCLYLWDNRSASPSYRARQFIMVGGDNPCWVVIPPGVVHAYRNVGEGPGVVINCPNRLYRGAGKKEAVDEIRHEDEAASPFRMD